MKKTVVALAAFGAFAGVAQAQSSVNLYGLVDVFIGKTTTRTTTPTGTTETDPGTSLISGGLNGSRWGLRGSEDLGGGLKANFQLEAGFSADTGTAAAPVGFNRTSKVGLSGGFGSIDLGRQYTQMFLLIDGFDAQGTSTFSATNALFGSTAAVAGGALSPSIRWNNSVVYSTPNFGGFSAAVQYAFGENGTPTASSGHSMGLSAGYAAGPLAVRGVHESVESAGPAATTIKTNGLGVSYDFSVVKVLAQLVNQKNGAIGGTKENGFVLGVVVPVGAGGIHASVGREAIKDNATGIKLAQATATSIEYRHDLSKRTTLYAGFNNNKLEDSITSTFSSTDRVYGVGIRHRF